MTRDRRKDPDEIETANPPGPPPLPRERMSERGLLLSLHERLDIALPAMLLLGEKLERVAETLAEHDKAWFTAMNFLEAEARASGANGRAREIEEAILARRSLTPVTTYRHDEPTNPGKK